MNPKLYVLFLFFIGHSSHAQLNVGLEAQYYFNNGNANADVGGINGVVNNATLTDDRFGCPNSAYNFDPALNSGISLGDNFDNIISGPDTQFSLSFWFNTLGNDNTDAPMFVKYGHSPCSEDQRQYGFELSSANKFSFVFASTLGGVNFIEVEGNTVVNDANWHHIVIIYDGTIDSNGGLDRVTMYLDNQLETVTTAQALGTTTEIQNGTAHTGIGQIYSSGGTSCNGTIQKYDGNLDDFRLYSKLLTPVEVDSLFNESSPCETESISEEKQNFIEVFPNPTSDILSFDMKSSNPANFMICDIQGREIFRGNANVGMNNVNVENLNSGLYFIQFVDKNGSEIGYTKFIKN